MATPPLATTFRMWRLATSAIRCVRMQEAKQETPKEDEAAKAAKEAAKAQEKLLKVQRRFLRVCPID